MKRPARDGWVRQRTDPDPAASYGAGFQSEDTMTSLTATQPPPTEVDDPPDALTLLIADQVGIRALALFPLPTERRGEGQRDVPVWVQGVRIAPGDWLCADEDGIVVADRALT